MWKRSTIPLSSCSWPMGICTATHRFESWLRSCSSTEKKSARSRSSMLTKTRRESPSCSQRSQRRVVCTSTPLTPLTTTSAPSTTRREASVSAWNPGSPGVSIRLILRSCHSTLQTAADSDICRFCSSSSQSATVELCSTEPRRFVAPPWKSSASTSDVLPEPRWPTTATLRILLDSVGATEAEFSGLLPAGSRYRSGEACLQTQNCLRVKLGNSRLGDAEHLADLPQGQLLVVVERDDELLALGKARNRFAECLAELRVRHRGLRLGGHRVLDRVDERHGVAARSGRGPELVQGCDRRAGDLEQRVLELLFGDAELLRDLLVGRRPREAAFEIGDRPLDVAGAGTDRARHPVHGAQF